MDHKINMFVGTINRLMFRIILLIEPFPDETHISDISHRQEDMVID
jgi:hypothetical protein